MDAPTTPGGGSMMAGAGPWGFSFRERERTSGGGATIEVSTAGIWRECETPAASGGGATTELSRGRTLRARLDWGSAGAGAMGNGSFSDQETMFGRAMLRFSLMAAGVTMVCTRLSASRGTEMTGWREYSASALPSPPRSEGPVRVA